MKYLCCKCFVDTLRQWYRRWNEIHCYYRNVKGFLFLKLNLNFHHTTYWNSIYSVRVTNCVFVEKEWNSRRREPCVWKVSQKKQSKEEAMLSLYPLFIVWTYHQTCIAINLKLPVLKNILTCNLRWNWFWGFMWNLL